MKIIKNTFFSVLMIFTSSFLYAQNDNLQNAANLQAEQNLQNVPGAAQIVIDAKQKLDSSFTKETAVNVEKQLLQIEPQLDGTQVKNLNDAFYSLLIDCKALQDEWKSIPQLYSRLQKTDAHSTYLAAAAYYKSQEYIIAEKLLEDVAGSFIAEADNAVSFANTSSDSDSLYSDSVNAAVLYAQVLSRRGKYKDSADFYAKLDAKKLLDSKNKLEYAKTLFLLKKYSEASAQAAAAQNPLSDYICGLCQFQLKNYDSARDFFKVYSIKSAQNTSAQSALAVQSLYSDYYYAVCLYRLASYKEAVPYFEKTGDSKSVPELTYKAYNYAAKSAVLSSDFTKAAAISEKLIKSASNDAERQSAVIFCAEVYADSGKYQKAISILEPFTTGKDDFSAKASFLKAKYYDKSDDIKSSVAAYQKVYENFPSTSYAEEAMFRCGELYYSRGQFNSAEEAFTKYLYEYSNGKFTDGALYFSGECNLKNNNLDRSIMQNKTLLEKYPQSSYVYGAGKNLLEAYYLQERYSEALETARMLVKNHRVQANSDNIGKRIIELEQITAGTDRRIVEKKSEYEQKGKLSTKEGRICGTELVKLYSKYGSQGEALSLALSLIQEQTDASEAEYGAENSEFAASYYAKNSNAKQSAEFYLKAAAFYRTAGNSQKAAASLYSAADSFMAASMKGDAQETAKLLVQLYPETKQAKKVMDLVK